MALTPNVVDGNVILAAWGNEIRDRTQQIFSTKAELDGWAAPAGAHAVTLDTNTLWDRVGAAWLPRTRSPWIVLPYGPGWSAATTNDNRPGYRIEADRAWTRGIVKCASPSTQSLIATLPVGYRPASAPIFAAWSYNSPSGVFRLDLSVVGALTIQGGISGAVDYLSLDQLSWSTTT